MGYLNVFVWGFLCGVATVVGTAAYIVLKFGLLRSSDEEDSSCRPLMGTQPRHMMSTQDILESLGLKPDEIEQLQQRAAPSRASPVETRAGSPPPLADTAPAALPSNPQADGTPSEEDEEDLEEAFEEALKHSKARLKDLKALIGAMTSLSQGWAAHGKSLEKVARAADANVMLLIKEGGTRAQAVSSDTWWCHLASTVQQLADEHKKLSDQTMTAIADRIQQLLERQAKNDKELSAEGSQLLKMLKESSTAYSNVEKEVNRVRFKVDAHVAKVVSTGRPAAEAKEHGEGKKLLRRLVEAQEELQSAYEAMREANSRFAAQMPRILDDYRILDVTNSESAKQMVNDFGDVLLETTNVSQRVAVRFCAVMKHLGHDAHDVVLNEALKGSAVSPSDPTHPLTIDMESEAMAALAATDPAKIPPLPPQLVAGISTESCVWFNAFSGRMYRDACASPFFHEWMSGVLFKLLNKGSRPGYIDEMRIENLRFGSMPPMLKNARWVPTSALRDAELKYDVAMVADMTYLGGFGFTVSSKISLNWPLANAASLPVSVDIELVELQGPVRIGVKKMQSYVSFLREPHSRFKVKTSFGDSGAQITNIPKLSSIIVTKLKAAINSKLVYPKAKTLKLLWQKNWWPETVEAELARREAEAATRGERTRSPLQADIKAQSIEQTPVTTSPPPQQTTPTGLDFSTSAASVVSFTTDKSPNPTTAPHAAVLTAGQPSQHPHAVSASSAPPHADHVGSVVSGGNRRTSAALNDLVQTRGGEGGVSESSKTSVPTGAGNKHSKRTSMTGMLNKFMAKVGTITTQSPGDKEMSAGTQSSRSRAGSLSRRNTHAPVATPPNAASAVSPLAESGASVVNGKGRGGEDHSEKVKDVDSSEDERDGLRRRPQDDDEEEEEDTPHRDESEDDDAEDEHRGAAPRAHAAHNKSPSSVSTDVAAKTGRLKEVWQGAWDEGESGNLDQSQNEERLTRREEDGVDSAVLEIGQKTVHLHFADLPARSNKQCNGLRLKRSRSANPPRLPATDLARDLAGFRLKRRHSFAGLTEFQSQFIRVHSGDEECDTEDVGAQGHSEVSRTRRMSLKLKVVMSKDDSHLYAEQRHHWWTRQLQGVYQHPWHESGPVSPVHSPQSSVSAPNVADSGKSLTSLATKLGKKLWRAQKGPSPATQDATATAESATGKAKSGGEHSRQNSDLSRPQHEHHHFVFSPGEPGGREEKGERDMSGWLTEAVIGVKSLGAAVGRKRWARLHNGHLVLFESEKEDIIKSILYVKESVCREFKESKSHAFELTASRVSNDSLLSPKRTVFYCSTEDELHAWVFRLQWVASQGSAKHVTGLGDAESRRSSQGSVILHSQGSQDSIASRSSLAASPPPTQEQHRRHISQLPDGHDSGKVGVAPRLPCRES